MLRTNKKYWMGAVLIALCLVTTAGLTTARLGPGSPVAAFDLNGAWKCTDGGKYYVRQIGNDVWWFGEGNGFGNAYKGRMTVNSTLGGGSTVAIVGDWIDLPRPGTNARGNGQLDLTVRTVSRFDQLGSTGGFGGSVWMRCPNNVCPS